MQRRHRFILLIALTLALNVAVFAQPGSASPQQAPVTRRNFTWYGDLKLLEFDGDALQQGAEREGLDRIFTDAGFDWRDPAGARLKVDEEIAETDREAAAGTPESLEEEYGDLLFALVNWGRLLGIHPDTALRRANRKFESRFRGLEALAAERGIDVERSSLDVLDGLWNEVKSAERS